MNRRHFFPVFLIVLLVVSFLVFTPPVYAAPLFSDGFESGDFMQWTGNATDAGNTNEASNAISHTGAWSQHTKDNGAVGPTAIVYKSYAGNNIVFIRLYVRFANISTQNDRYIRIVDMRNTASGSVNTAAGIKRDGAGDLYWFLHYRNNTVYTTLTSAGPAIAVDTWYCVEVKTDCSTANGQYDGEVRLYVDGIDRLNATSIDTDYTTIDKSEVGLGVCVGTLPATAAWFGNANWIESYQDCVVVDTSYIGVEGAAGSDGVILDSPTSGSTNTSFSVTFDYTPTFYETIENASLWLNITGNWQEAAWNASAVANASSNSITYTFTDEDWYIWNVAVYNSSDRVFDDANYTIKIDVAPRWQNAGSNSSSIQSGGNIALYAQAYDGWGVDWAWLSTNETGAWLNYTTTTIDEDLNYAYQHLTKYAYNPLNTPSPAAYPDPDNQSIHDDILYFADGWGSDNNGDAWQYWLAMTPYNGLDSQYENPCILVSNSSTGPFQAPAGLANPIDAQPAPSYNSDPELYYNSTSGTMYCYYREANATYIMLHRRNSTDGFQWGAEETVMEGATGAEMDFASESIIEESGTLYMFYVYGPAAPNTIRYRNSTDGGATWNNWTQCTAVAPGAEFWHLDVTSYNSTYWMTLVDANYDLYYGNSTDKDNWTFGGSTILANGAATEWDANQYRGATIVLADATLYLYYSGWNASANPHTGLATAVFQQAGGHDPVDMGDAADAWTWSNWTWTNSSIANGNTVQWRIYYNDTAGNVNVTDIASFTIQSGQWVNFTLNENVAVWDSESIGKEQAFQAGNTALSWDSSSKVRGTSFTAGNTVLPFAAEGFGRELAFQATGTVITWQSIIYSTQLAGAHWYNFTAVGNIFPLAADIFNKAVDFQAGNTLLVFAHETFGRELNFLATQSVTVWDSAEKTKTIIFTAYANFNAWTSHTTGRELGFSPSGLVRTWITNEYSSTGTTTTTTPGGVPVEWIVPPQPWTVPFNVQISLGGLVILGLIGFVGYKIYEDKHKDDLSKSRSKWNQDLDEKKKKKSRWKKRRGPFDDLW